MLDFQTINDEDVMNNKVTECDVLEISETLKDMVKCICRKGKHATEKGFIKEFEDAYGDPVEENCEDLFNREYAEYVKQRNMVMDETYEVNEENFEEIIDAYSLVRYILRKYIGSDPEENVCVNGDDEQMIAHYYLRDKDGNRYEYYEKTVVISDPHIDDTMFESWFKMNDKYLVEPMNESLLWDII